MNTYCSFRTYQDSDDWADRIIGYPTKSERTPERAQCADAMAASQREQTRQRVAAVTAVAQELGRAGQSFTARELATRAGLTSAQVSRIMPLIAVNVGRERTHDAWYWRLNEYPETMP